MQRKQVRALVRSAAKAKEVLSCGDCTPADGIFVGDVTDPSTLPEAFDGVKQVVVLTGTGGRAIDLTLSGLEVSHYLLWLG